MSARFMIRNPTSTGWVPLVGAADGGSGGGGDGGGGGGTPKSTLFGARCGPLSAASPGGPQNAAESNPAAQTRVYAALGPLAVERWFNLSGNLWQVPRTSASTLMLSVAVAPGQTANGANDANWLTLLRTLKQTTWVSLAQEVDNGDKGFTPPQFKADMAYLKHVLIPQVRTGITIATTTIFTSFNIHAGTADQWVPAAADYDVMGVDCYANQGIPALNTLTKAYQQGVNFATKYGKPLIIPETSFGTGPGHGGQGYTDAQVTQMVSDGIAYLKANSVVAVSWFESDKADGNWLLEGIHPAAQALWQAACRASVL